MNYCNYGRVLIIFLFITGVTSFALAQDFKYDNYRRVSEKCIRGCDEEKPRAQPKTSKENSFEGPGIVVTITQGEMEFESPSQPQWQIPTFGHERASRRGSTGRYRDYPIPSSPSGARDVRTGEYYPPAAGGVTDPKTGTFYQDVGGGYVNSKTGEFYPKVGR
jgi:hypothetical protein